MINIILNSIVISVVVIFISRVCFEMIKEFTIDIIRFVKNLFSK